VKVFPTDLPEVLRLAPDRFGDDRGYFFESFHVARYAAAGIPDSFVQDNVSRSRRGVLRGLHFQQPRAQGKLVSVLEGDVFDVAVDVRVGSPRFGRWVGEVLSSSNGHQLWLPPGFAHGFLVLSDEALLTYKCTDYYDRASELCIRWDDPSIGIEWPMRDVTLSSKDQAGASLDAIGPDRLMAYDG
jgi:dTDP-4-dehydrorhamnose 3,5-epimerase